MPAGLLTTARSGVFIENIERDGFCLDARRSLIRNFDRDDFARSDMMGSLARSAIDLDAAFVHQRLDARTAECRKLGDEKNIEALAGFFGSDDEFHAWASVN